MADYPGTLPTFAANGANLSTAPHSALHIDLNQEVVALATTLGTNPQGTLSTVKARLDKIAPYTGALTAWTPTVAQGGAVTVTVDSASTVWSRVGRTVHAWFNLSVTGTGTGTNAIVVTVPVAAASSSPQLVIGEGFVYDSSATLKYKALMVMASTATGMAFIPTDGSGIAHMGETGGGFIAGLASGDLLAGHISYPAAAD